MADQRYTIHEQLGAGGNGAVFRAYDTQLKRWVAIKRLLSASEASSNTPDSTELRREADTLASLRNANIVTIFDVLSDAEGLFMVMELLEGPDLADAIQHGPLMQDDFKQLAEQTLEALLAAHNLRILHRDIKPENIKVERLAGGRLQAKIIDFGLARSGLAARKQTEDQEGSVMGSIYYMAPEQLSREPTDMRTDLYALGCVFYETLAGRKAFDGKSVNEVIDKHLDHDLVPLNQLCPHLPQWLTYWVMRLMACKPDDRPANAQQAIEEFRAWEKLPPAPGMMPWMPANYGYAPMPTYAAPMQGYGGTGTVPLFHQTTGQVPVQTGGYYVPAHITSSSVPVAPQPQSSSVPVAIPMATMVPEAIPVAAPTRPTGPQRPTGGAPKSAAPKTPTHTRGPARTPRPAAEPESPEAAGKKKMLMIYGGAGVAVIVLGAILLTRGGGKETAKNSGPSPGSGLFANTITVGRAREDLYPQERGFPTPANMRVAHFVARVATRGYTGSNPAAQIDTASPVSVWEDLADRGDNTPLVSVGFKAAASPERITWNTEDKAIKDGRIALSFKSKSGQPVAMRLYQADKNKESFPFGSATAGSGGAGLALAVMMQAPGDHLPCRVLHLTSGDGKSSVTLRVTSSRTLEAEFISPGGKAKLSSAQVDATKPCQAILHWSKTGDVLLRTRDQRGATHGARGKATPPTVPLYDLELGGTGSDRAQQFSGVIADVIMLSTTQKDDQSALMDKELREHYFNLPKPGALNPLRNFKLADFPIGEERDIFNGRDLTGWEAGTKYWSVSDGALTAKGDPSATTTTANCYAYWKDGTVGDCEVRLKVRITGGNGGIFYRGNVGGNSDTGPTISGYQYEIDSGRKDRWGLLMDANIRGDLGRPAQKVKVKDQADVRKAIIEAQDKALGDPGRLVGTLKTGEWNDIRIVADGNKVQHYVNEKLVLELVDEGHGRFKEGVIGFESQPKGGINVQFKDIRVKRLR